MPYPSLQYLPHEISCSKSIENEFKTAFSSEESKRAKGIVYFFLSENQYLEFLAKLEYFTLEKQVHLYTQGTTDTNGHYPQIETVLFTATSLRNMDRQHSDISSQKTQE